MKIEIFSRHTFFSKISAHKKRPPLFSHEKCFRNLVKTTDFEKANLTILYDRASGPLENHFLHGETRFPIIEIDGGSETASFLFLIDYATKNRFDENTILYFVEDDYLHLPGWTDRLIEAFTLDIDYATLYDHKDKYVDYPKLTSKIWVTKSSHWRETPSTTNTFATKVKTLVKDIKIHRKYSEGLKITKDHQKFLHLKKKNRILVSSIPGYATHAEPDFASPCTMWDELLK